MPSFSIEKMLYDIKLTIDYTFQSPAAGAVLCFTVLHLFSGELL